MVDKIKIVEDAKVEKPKVSKERTRMTEGDYAEFDKDEVKKLMKSKGGK